MVRNLRRRFKCGYGGFGFYDHSDIVTKMVWSQGGHIKRRLLYILSTFFYEIVSCEHAYKARRLPL